MDELSQNPKNSYTIKLLDLKMIKQDNGTIGLFVVMEHMESDIKKLLNQSSEIELFEDHILMIIYNTLCAIKFLHSANIIHRDLKPANILVD